MWTFNFLIKFAWINCWTTCITNTIRIKLKIKQITKRIFRNAFIITTKRHCFFIYYRWKWTCSLWFFATFSFLSCAMTFELEYWLLTTTYWKRKLLLTNMLIIKYSFHEFYWITKTTTSTKTKKNDAYFIY